MIRLAGLVSIMWVLGCSDVTEGAGGVIELEVATPAVTQLEVGEVLQLSARALDKDGNPVAVPITWRTSDATITVDDTGRITGIAPGPGQVQAFVGSLGSARVPVTVIARADTLAIVGDSVVIVAPEATASTPLVVQLLSFTQAGPLTSRPVVYLATFPPTVPTAPVQLPGGVVIDTISTGATGLDQSITLSRVPGVTAPDTAYVIVRSYRTSGVDVPGSGQRFIVLFQ